MSPQGKHGDEMRYSGGIYVERQTIKTQILNKVPKIPSRQPTNIRISEKLY